MNKIQVLGISSYLSGVIYDILRDNEGIDCLDIYLNQTISDKPETPILSFPYSIFDVDTQPDKKLPMIFGVSGPKNKFPIYEYFTQKYAIDRSSFKSVVHKSCYIAKSSVVGNGCFLEQNVTISSQTKLGFGVTVKRGVLIGHHDVIDDFVDINPGAIIAGRVSIGKGAVIGAGAILIDRVKIGENSFVGAGSVVTKDIPAGVIAYGNPCRVIQENLEWKID